MEFKVCKLNHNNKGFMIDNQFVDTTFDNVDEFINDDKSIGYYVANDKDVLGYIYGYVLTRFNSNPMLNIHSVDVNEKYRRLGVGTLMVDAMIDYAIKKNLYKVFLITNKSNQKAIGLYTKAGGRIMYEDDVVFEWKNGDLKL